VNLNDEQMRQTGVLKHLVKPKCGHRLERLVFYQGQFIPRSHDLTDTDIRVSATIRRSPAVVTAPSPNIGGSNQPNKLLL
jgi:hypothetical protein